MLWWLNCLVLLGFGYFLDFWRTELILVWRVWILAAILTMIPALISFKLKNDISQIFTLKLYMFRQFCSQIFKLINLIIEFVKCAQINSEITRDSFSWRVHWFFKFGLILNTFYKFKSQNDMLLILCSISIHWKGNFTWSTL